MNTFRRIALVIILALAALLPSVAPAQAVTNLDGIYGYIDWYSETGWVNENHVEVISYYDAASTFSQGAYTTIYVAAGRYNSGKYWCEQRTGPAATPTVIYRFSGSWSEASKIRRNLVTSPYSYSLNPRVYCNIYVPVTADYDPDFGGNMYLDPSK